MIGGVEENLEDIDHGTLWRGHLWVFVWNDRNNMRSNAIIADELNILRGPFFFNKGTINIRIRNQTLYPKTKQNLHDGFEIQLGDRAKVIWKRKAASIYTLHYLPEIWWKAGPTWCWWSTRVTFEAFGDDPLFSCCIRAMLDDIAR